MGACWRSWKRCVRALADAAAMLALQDTTRTIVAVGADLSGSTFSDVALRKAVFRDVDLSNAVIENVKMAGTRISEADLSGCAIAGCRLDAMTIDGVAVSELFAAWRTAEARR